MIDKNSWQIEHVSRPEALCSEYIVSSTGDSGTNMALVRVARRGVCVIIEQIEPQNLVSLIECAKKIARGNGAQALHVNANSSLKEELTEVGMKKIGHLEKIGLFVMEIGDE